MEDNSTGAETTVITADADTTSLPKNKKRTSRKRANTPASLEKQDGAETAAMFAETFPSPEEELEPAQALEQKALAEVTTESALLDYLHTRLDNFHHARQELEAETSAANLQRAYQAVDELSFSLKIMGENGVGLPGGQKLNKWLRELRKELVRLGRRSAFLENLALFTQTRSYQNNEQLMKVQARLQRQKDKANGKLLKLLNKRAVELSKSPAALEAPSTASASGV